MPAFIHSIGTALPPYITPQSDIADFMVSHLKLSAQEERKLRILYRASGIRQRHSVLPDFSAQNRNDEHVLFKEGERFPTARPRMKRYQQYALELAREACECALKGAKTEKADITHLVAVSCTGMYAPGLDIELIESMQLATSTQRTSINFMGCYAAFNGMKTAASIVKADAAATVLVVCVELCTLHLQEKTDDENLLANAIFSDGAAALIVDSKPSTKSLELIHFYSDLALAGKQEMGWYIGDFGFEMRLSPKVPDVVQEGIEELTRRLLSQVSLTVNDVSFFAIHPGGKRILEVIEDKLAISKEQNAPARTVLKSMGNMSSPTILFVIKSILDQLTPADHGKNMLSFAFGPGLTLESAVMKVHFDA